jgi:MFS family permease
MNPPLQPRGKLDLRLLVSGSAALSISTLFSSMKPVVISGLVEQAGYSTALAGLAAAMPFIGGVAASLLLPRLGNLSTDRTLRLLGAALPLVELGNAAWLDRAALLLAGQFCAGLCGGMILGLISRLIARSTRADETFGLADMVGVLLMSLMLAAVGSAVAMAGLRGGFLVAALFCILFAVPLFAASHDAVPPTAEVGQSSVTANATARPTWQAAAIIATGMVFVTFSGLGFAFMVTVARTLGFGYEAASSAIGTILLVSASGCFVGGWCAARIGPKVPLLCAFALCAIGWHVALHAHAPAVFLAALLPAIFALQFCFPVLLSLAGSVDETGRVAAIGAPLIVSGFAWAAILAGLIVKHWGIGALSAGTSAGMATSAVLLLIGTRPVGLRYPAEAVDRRPGGTTALLPEALER